MWQQLRQMCDRSPLCALGRQCKQEADSLARHNAQLRQRVVELEGLLAQAGVGCQPQQGPT